MKNNEKFWKITEIVLGAIGAALLILILVLRILGKEVTMLVYPIVAIVILFLVSDEIARTIRRRREKEEAEREKTEHPEKHTGETILPKDAFEFEEKPKEKQP